MRSGRTGPNCGHLCDILTGEVLFFQLVLKETANFKQDDNLPLSDPVQLFSQRLYYSCFPSVSEGCWSQRSVDQFRDQSTHYVSILFD